MKTQYKWLLTKAAIITIFVTIIVLAEINIYAVTVATTMMVCVMIMLAKRMRKAYPRDERTKKLGAYAAAYSWIITLLTASFLFWVDHLSLYSLTVKQAILIIGAVMLGSQILIQWHFMRRGDA
jgi:hypothetical protein